MPDGQNGGFEGQLRKWEKEQDKWLKEVNVQQAKLYGDEARATAGLPEDKMPWWASFVSALTPFAPFEMPPVAKPGVEAPWYEKAIYQLSLAKEKYRATGTAEVEVDRVVYEEAVKNFARAQWFTTFYSSIPALVASGKVTSYSDYLNVMKSSPEAFLTDEQVREAGEAISNLLPKAVFAKEEIPDFLETTPEEEAVIREFLVAARPRPVPIGIQTITVDEIMKALAAGPPLAKPPEGMSMEEFLQVAAIMDIPEEVMVEVKEVEELIAPFADAWSEQEASINAVLAGLKEWEMPDMSLWEKTKFAALQPMQVMADVIKPYLEHVTYPMVGFVVTQVQRILSGTQDVERHFDQLRASGMGRREAYSKAHEGWDLNWGLKLLLEIGLDPITYIPGLLLSGPGKLAAKLGLHSVSRGFMATNKALWTVLDIPFDFGKAVWRGFPKATSQMVRAQTDAFHSSMFAGITEYVMKVKGVAKSFDQLTVDDIAEALVYSRAKAIANPMAEADVFVGFGRYLLQHKPIEPDDILKWSKSAGGKLTPDDLAANLHSIVDDVNNILRDSVHGYGNLEVNAKRLAMALMVEDSPKVLKLLATTITRYTTKYATRIDRVIEMGKTAIFQPQARMIDALATAQRDIIRAFTTSTYYKSRTMSGFVLGLTDKVDKLDGAIWRNYIDRFAVRPMAEANLGSVAYPHWNAFEAIFVSAAEGVMPGQMTLEAFQRTVIGLKGVDARLLTGGASDIVGMLGSLPGREGVVSFLPGKIPEKIIGLKTPKWLSGKDYLEWSGRKWIEFSDVWGNAYRRNFVARRFNQEVADMARDVAGKDINKAVGNLVGKVPIKIRKAIGITEHDLRQEAAQRAFIGDKNAIWGMKEMLTNGSLMQKEQLKILRQYMEISPQARTLGENWIARNEAIVTLDSINDYARILADQSIADLKAFNTQAPDAFRWMADGIEAETIHTADDLMQVFQHYEVMVDTAGGLPSKYVSEIFGKADELYRVKKFGAVEKLWRESREEMIGIVGSIHDDLERVRSKVLANTHLLKPKQKAALEDLLERASARDALREQTLRFDGQLLDDFWALPKAVRTPEEHAALRAYRGEIWLDYRKENAVLGAGDFVQRKAYAKLYHGLPEEKLFPVDAMDRVLSSQDIAKVMGCNVDALTTGIMETMVMQDKFHFIQVVRQMAERRPTLFKGFTDEKIAQAYDNILRSVKMTPDMDIAAQKILMQVEDIKQRMIELKMLKALTPNEEAALHGWIDNIAKGMDDVFGDLPEGSWKATRQKALDNAQKSYYKAFADYAHQNIIDFAAKHIYPYWTYHMYRWFWLPRTFIRRPGVMAAWGKYYNYTEYGYITIPGLDVEVNPFVGSVFGTTFGLARHDFKSYYESLGWTGEVLDYTMRRGFFPGVHIMAPIVATSIFSGRPPEMGDVLPPIGRTAIELFVASPIPGVRDSAQWLRDKVFHENFRDYYVETFVSEMQAEAGGKLIGGQSGADLGHKRRRGEPLTEEEQAVWDEASNKTAWMTALRSQFPIFRLRPEEFREAKEKVTKIFEEYLGMSPEFQKNLWLHNLRPTDVVGGMPLDVRMALDQLWEWQIWLGRGAALMPPGVSDLLGRINKFWNISETYQMTRVETQVELDSGFLTPTKELHFSGREWREERANNWSTYVSNFETLKEQEEYKDIPWTPEEAAELYRKQGFSVPVRGPIQEAQELYFSIELEKKKRPYSDEEDWDYLGFYLKREAIKMALTEEQRMEFDAWMRKLETPLERVFRSVVNTYFRGYWAVPRILIENYSEEQKLLINEFYADITTMDRRDELRDIINPATGNKLVAEWQRVTSDARAKLREASPQLDFYLYVFDYVSVPKTPEAEEMIRKWEVDKTTILTR